MDFIPEGDIYRLAAKSELPGAEEFIRFLLDKKYLCRDKRGRLIPYAGRVEEGLFEIKESLNEKTKWSRPQTLVTPKGRETFRLLCLQSA